MWEGALMVLVWRKCDWWTGKNKRAISRCRIDVNILINPFDVSAVDCPEYEMLLYIFFLFFVSRWYPETNVPNPGRVKPKLSTFVYSELFILVLLSFLNCLAFSVLGYRGNTSPCFVSCNIYCFVYRMAYVIYCSCGRAWHFSAQAKFPPGDNKVYYIIIIIIIIIIISSRNCSLNKRFK